MAHTSMSISSEIIRYNNLRQSAVWHDRIVTVSQLLSRAAHLYGSATALIYQDESLSFKELYARACGMSEVLRQKGIGKGDIVLMLIENSIDFYIAYYGVVQTGAVIAPLNTFLTPQEVEHIVRDAHARLIILSDQWSQKLEGSILLSSETVIFSSLNSQAQKTSANNFIPVWQDPDELVVLLYTSGTTGFPKGVMLSSRNIITNVIQGLARMGLPDGLAHKLLGALPLFHSFAQFICVWGALFIGCSVIIVPKIERAYIIKAFKHIPTVVMGVPALFGLFCLLRIQEIEHVRYCVAGGDALPDKINAIFARLFGRKIAVGYGLTEASPLIAAFLEDELVDPGTVGPVCIGMQVKIINSEDGVELNPGQTGELWVKGDNIMMGYYQAPELTAQVLCDGWLRTGDSAYINNQNQLVLVGRLKDLIKHKGIKIYPGEIENIILNHPQVLQVAVIPREDVDTGQVPVAYVKVTKVSPEITEQLHALCRAKLALYKIPRTIICTTQDLPRTSLGKIDKKALIAQDKNMAD